MTSIPARSALPHGLARVAAAALVAIASMSSVTPVSAQTTGRFDLSAGFLTTGSMHGVNAQASFPVTSRWSVIGEVDWSQGHDPGSDDYLYRDLAVLGGVRHTTRPGSRVSPFFQVMAGGLHSEAEGSYCLLFGGGCYTDSFSSDYLAVQPGGGLTIMVSPRVGVRIQADLQFAISPEYGAVSLFPRVVVGGLVRLGRTPGLRP